ncbi:MAG: dehydrogenase [Gemmatimonadetes bacterium]|nr:dehydrogenase [Gemmatimonadota bacterium]
MTTKITVGITRDFFDAEGNFDLPGPGLELFDDMPGVQYQILAERSAEIAPEQVRGCDAVISAGSRWSERSLVGNDQLVAVLFTGVGYDHIDVEALTRANAMLCTAPDAVRRPMACTIITFVLALATRLINKDRITRQGRWTDQHLYRGEGLTGKTLGSIGVGNIGHEMFLMAKPFGMRHLGCDPKLRPEDVADVDVELVAMDTLLAESDFVSISVPLSEQTRHLIGERELNLMKPTAYLINTSRGPVVDEQALIRILQSGRIRGAGLDVFEQEPVDADNPLLKMDNVVVAPHSLCHTDEYYMQTWRGRLRQVARIERGEIPEHVVNREVLEKPKLQAKLERLQRR